MVFASLLLAAGMLAAPSVEARLSGEAELGYQSFDSEVNGAKRDASSFQQRYSLLYGNDGRLGKGSLGKYKYALGYEWGSVDTELKTPTEETNPSVSAGHILFNGELSFTPMNLPVRFSAYSRDMNRIRFLSDSISGPVSTGDDIITPGINDNLMDGTRVSSGATLWLGVRNDLREDRSSVFMEIPVLLVDYQDDYVRDMKSLTQQNTRSRKLALVGYKKNNWLHYRQSRHDDYLNRDSSFREDRYILGSVDHRLNRTWSDLTNWITISADGQFIKRQDQSLGNSETYDLNLFAVASREKWEARTFNTLNRTLDVTGLTTITKVPLHIQGVWGAETDWKVRLSSDREKRIMADRSLSDRDDLLASLQVYTFKRSQFTLSPSISVERVEQNKDRTIAFDGGVETASTRRFSDIFGLSAGYKVKVFSAEGTVNSDYLEQTITGRGVYKVSDTIRFVLEENITTAGGTRNEIANTTITANQGFLGGASSTTFRTRDEPTEGFSRFVTTFTTSWTPLARLRVGFTAAEDIFKPDNGDTDIITSLGNTIDYSLPNFAVGSNVRYRTRSAGSLRSNDIAATGTASYTPNRNIKASIRYTYAKVKENDTVTTNVDLAQKFTYTVNSLRGGNLKLLDLTEELTYEKADNTLSFSQFSSKKRLTLGATYYPTKNIFVAATARYSLLDPGDEKEWMGSGAVGAVFNKLQANIDYSYGRRYNSETRTEKRFSANLKKQF